jgi:hypothetical protein
MGDGASLIEYEMCVGWDDSLEPTPFVRAVSRYLAGEPDRPKAAAFDKRFFSHLD